MANSNPKGRVFSSERSEPPRSGAGRAADRGESKHRLPVVQDALNRHVRQLSGCTTCKGMIGPVVAPPPVVSPIYLVGQAPGPHEGALGRPFAWTAGKTLFRWFGTLGVDEAKFRERAYIGAVCRCFPGKTASGGDRVPSPAEIQACSRWAAREIALLTPRLVIPVGKLAITQVLGKDRPLAEVIGQTFRASFHGHEADVVPLPHPSGASTWFKMEPGRGLLEKGLERLGDHEAWREVFASAAAPAERATKRA
jgi:uracil-DNA glycosylase